MFTPCLALLLSVTAPWASVAQDKLLTPAHVARLRTVSSATISPDGARLAYTLSVPRVPLVDEDGNPWTELHVIDLVDNRDRTFIGGKSNVSQVRFSPDGASLFFLDKRGDDKFTCLYNLSLLGGEAQRAAKLGDSISAYSLSPDGTRAAVIALLPEDAKKKKRVEQGFKQEIYEEDMRWPRVQVVDLFDANAEARVLDIEGGKYSPTQVVWSPTDDRLALALAPSPLVDDEMMKSRVHVVDAITGIGLARFDQSGKLGQITWSPDGQRLAVVSAEDEHDTAAGRIFAASTEGGPWTDLLPGFLGHVEKLAWLDANRLAYVAAEGVWSSVGVVDASAPTLAAKQLLGPGGAVMSDISVSRNGKQFALLGSTPSHPQECFSMTDGDIAPQRRTRSNPELDSIRLALQEVVRFQARDKMDLEGVLIRPLDEEAGVRYPLILNVHGGPEACQSNGWLTSYSNPGQVAASRGMAVLHLNYRGSTGRGVAFAKSSQGGAAGAEFDDLIDGIDYLIDSGLVDKNKVGVTGGSYGGYATGWLSTRYSERIAAGVMFVGISDKVSKVGTTDIANEEFMVHSLKRPWDDWQHLLEQSPIYHTANCKTPLLILHGKDDPRVNVGQSRELFRHLKLREQAPVRLVLYPGEGHGNRKSGARFDYNLRQLQWLEHYLTGAGGEMPPYELDYDGQLAAQ
jgi:dipeptidyl aminopeptidase/acylaminoacyl peptidase